MGWKNIKTEYRIGHIVKVTSDGICIGSGYIGDLIVISLEGTLVKRYAERGNDDLARYQHEMDADPEKLQRLATTADAFEKAIKVYTYEGASIIEKQCEEPGWPNVTHYGQLMYDNTHSTDKAKVVEWARKNAAAGVRRGLRNVQESEASLAKARDWLAEAQADLAALDRDYPIPTPSQD